MTKSLDFDLKDFMPYLLNQAAETTSHEFQTTYKSKYGMLQTEWRVVFHLGRYGSMTAKEICDRARLHKTKVSRAVQALEAKKYLTRTTMTEDRRHEMLALTKSGNRVFADLYYEAQSFDAEIMAGFTEEERCLIRDVLIRLAKF